MKKTAAFTLALTVISPLKSGAEEIDTMALEEVVVTAQRKEESLQKAPLSIDALTSDDLVARDIRSASNLTEQVPGLQATNPAGWRPVFSLRGISMADYSINQSNPIGLYLDETYLGANSTHGLAFFDLERVEVLKGPQGTLYGKNTTGGAINLISHTPDLNQAGENILRYGFGNYDEHRIFAAAETVLVPGRLATRAAFDFDQDDGWWHNVNGPNMAQTRRASGRLTLNGQISDELNAVLRLNIARSTPRFTPPRTYGVIPVPGKGLFNYAGYSRDPDYGFREGAINRMGQTNSDFNHVSLKLTYDPGSLKFVSVSSWYNTQAKFGQDTDGSPVSLLEIDWFDQHEAFSEDFRVESDWDGPFSFISGIYISQDEDKMRNLYSFLKDGPVLLPLAYQKLLSNYGMVDQQMNISSVSTAAYTQARYQFTERLGADAGVRFTVDQNDLDYMNISRLGYDHSPVGSWVPGNITGINAAYLPPTATPPSAGRFLNGAYTQASLPQQEHIDQSWTGKTGLDYALTNNMMVYGNYSRGYRSGNYNPGVMYSPASYLNTGYTKPETVDAFEVGVKSDWFNKRLRLNMSGYYYDYQNQQIINVVGGSSQLLNAGASHIYGLENEFMVIPLDGLRVSLGTNVMNTTYDALSLANTSTPDPRDQVDLAGNQLVAAPNFKLTGAIDYSFESGFGGFFDVGVSGNYQTRQWYSAYNDTPGYQSIQQQPYGLMNARIAYNDSKGRYTLALHSENLLDENYDVYAVNLASGFGYNSFLPGPPRRYGFDVSVKF
ncbi:MAG: TonB-dependent receptor [Methylococcaceae bacterium]